MSTGTLQSRTARLAAFVRRVRLSVVATVLVAGVLLALAIALAWVLGGVILDLALPLSVPGRLAVWCGWWAAVAAACGAFLLVPAARRPVIDSIALSIERALGGFHNRLLTVVDLARRGGLDVRPDLVERLLEQTQERLHGFRLSGVLPWRAVLRNLFIAAACAALLMALFLGLGARFLITLERLLTPTADIPPATWLQLASPGDLEVLAGEPFEIEGRVVRSAIDEIDLVLYDADGRASRQPMQAGAAGVFVAALEGLDRPVRYRLEGGNTWTKTHDVRILERPEIRSLVRRVRLPEYMRIDEPLPVADGAAQIEAPFGAQVEFEAVASEEAAMGSLQLFTRTLESRVVERFDERVWFEDDLPRDAVIETPWKWTTARAAGGLRSFTFAAAGHPLVMLTRLDRLVLPGDRLDSRAFMVMARSDAADPPGRLSVLLAHDRGRTELVWGDVAGAPPVSAADRIAAGPLPPPGEWARLSAPMKLLAGLAGQAVGGMTVSIDRGRVLLDRPGWVERSEEIVKRPIDQPAGEIDLARVVLTHQPDAETMAADSPWLGRVPVERPIWATIEFRSPQGHPSLPAPPVEIVPTVDRPPSIVVDDTPETVTLKVADDLPLRGRGFDDWGIDALSVLIGPDPEHLGPPVPVPGVSPADRPPSTQVAIATSLAPEMLGIGPGKSAAWKLRIRDTKGQIAESKVFRVTVMMPPEAALAKTQVPALAQAQKEAESLAKEAEKKADAVDEKQEAVREALAKDEKPEKKDVEAVTRKLEQEERTAEQLAKTTAQAAAQAAKSELVPEAQKQALEELAARAKALEERVAGNQSAAKPDAKPEAPADSKAESKPDAQRESASDKTPSQPSARTQAQQAEAAKAERVADAPKQEQVAEAAKEIARELEAVEQRLNAKGAALRLESLAEDLQRRAADLVKQPPAQANDHAARQMAREQVRDVEQILGRKFPESKQKPDAAKASEERTAQTPPATPSDEVAQSDAAKSALKPTQNQAAQPNASQPAPNPAQQPARDPNLPDSAAVAAARAASAAAATAAQLADRLSGEPQGPASPVADAATPPPPPSQPDAQAGKPADGPATTTESIQALLESKEVDDALDMAERAQRLQARAAAVAEAAARAAVARQQAENGRQPRDADRTNAVSRRTDEVATDDDKTDRTGRSEGGAVASRADIDAAELLRGLDARQRAALYKLPPRIRDPLLEGMRQRGPAAYQNVIDTYFRQLGKDIPQ